MLQNKIMKATMGEKKNKETEELQRQLEDK